MGRAVEISTTLDAPTPASRIKLIRTNPDTPHFCRGCGAELVSRPHGAKRVWCSPTCRIRTYYEPPPRPVSEPKPLRVGLRCLVCGESLPTQHRGRNRRYC